MNNTIEGYDGEKIRTEFAETLLDEVCKMNGYMFKMSEYKTTQGVVEKDCCSLLIYKNEGSPTYREYSFADTKQEAKRMAIQRLITNIMGYGINAAEKDLEKIRPKLNNQ